MTLKNLLSITLFTIILSAYTQDVKEENTKMDAFASKIGVIVKFIDYSLPNLKLTYGVAEVNVRKMISGGEEGFFFQISHEGQYGTKTASIAYEDLLEINKAISALKNEAQADIDLNPDYLENKFRTEDGFQLGYYISKGKIAWYLKLEKYGSGNTIFVNQLSLIEASIQEGLSKIESLRNK